MNIRSGYLYKVKTKNGKEVILRSGEVRRLLDDTVSETEMLEHEYGTNNVDHTPKMNLNKDFIVEQVK